MFNNINDFTTNGFIAALNANNTIIGDGQTASQLLASAGVNIVSARLAGSSGARSQEQQLIQYYSLNFDIWYLLAKYALSNINNADAPTAKFAQQLAARFVPFAGLKVSALSAIISPTAKVQSETLIPTYNFIPNIASIFDTPLNGRTLARGVPYNIEARVSTDFVGSTLVLGIYNSAFTLVESVSADVNAEGFVIFAYTPTAIVASNNYIIALKDFTIFSPSVYSAGLIANINTHFVPAIISSFVGA